MPPIGYHYYVATHATPPARLRSITETAGHKHDMTRGMLLTTIIAAVPVLIAAVFMLVFRV